MRASLRLLSALVLGLGGCDVTAVLGSGSESTPPPSGQPGVWENVTPASVSLDPSFNPAGSYGVQEVLADPVRPSNLYAFICYQGVWKSTDYGLSWTKVSTGANGAVLDTGRPTAAIDPNPARDPSTPPTLFTTNASGTELGVFKSIDGGVSWTHASLPGDAAQDDVAYLSVDPRDGQHLLASNHPGSSLAESTDGGQTWVILTTPAELGAGVYPFFVDTGNPGRSTIWITEAQWGDPTGTNGMWRTTDSGVSWAQVESLEHALGTAQMVQPSGGSVIYTAGAYGTKGNGVYRSPDGGVTWALVATGLQTMVFATSQFLYAAASGASQASIAPAFLSSPLSSGTTWASMTTPPAMTNGPKNAAVTNDGTHEIVVTANWLAGIWRYVEP